MPLKGIPAIISPDLLHVLARMGHGDEIGRVMMEFFVSFRKAGNCKGGAKLKNMTQKTNRNHVPKK